jgi:hypothetical protein
MAEFNKKFKPKQTDSKKGLFVDVQEGQFEKAFRKFRNKVEDSGLLIVLFVVTQVFSGGTTNCVHFNRGILTVGLI